MELAVNGRYYEVAEVDQKIAALEKIRDRTDSLVSKLELERDYSKVCCSVTMALLELALDDYDDLVLREERENES